MEKEKASDTKKSIPTYTKEKLLTFKRFANRVDLLRALLRENEEYTIEQAETAIDSFMKGKVN